MPWLGAEGRTDRLARVADVVLALGLTAFVASDALGGGGWPEPRGVCAVLAGGAGLSLAWRRVHPVGAAVASLGLLSCVAVFVGSFQAGSSVLIALVAVWSAAAHGRRPVVTAVAALCVAAAMGARTPWPGSFYNALWVAIALSLPLGAGLALRRLTRRHDDLAEASRAAADAHDAAMEQQRLGIARELHDIISHGIGFMVLQAGVAERLLEEHPDRAREALESIRHSGSEAVDELSRLLSLVRAEPEASREPPPALVDVEGLAAEARAAGVDVVVERHGSVDAASPAVELNAYRVVQEGLTNAVKHAPGAAVRIVLTRTPAYVRVEIKDTGEPGGRRSQVRSTQFGLAGLRERVALFGGDVDAGTEPEGGWHLRATFPLEPA